MNDEQKASVRELIAAELAGTSLKALPGPSPEEASQPAQAPVQNNEPTYPSEVSLDEYETLMVEALGWRVEAAEKTGALLNREKDNINLMKRALLDRCIRRLGVDVNKHNLLIDSGRKIIKIEKRG